MQTRTQIKSALPLSTRVLNVPKSATLAINERSKQLQSEGRDIIRLGLGQSPFPVPQRMVDELRAYASAKDYMTVQGYLPLRETIAGYMQRTEGLDCNAGDIIVGPGSKELFFGLQMALDCELALPAPSWVSYDPQARLLGRSVNWLPCRAEDGWKLTAQTLDQHCQKRAGVRQLLIINSPNNPSGACYGADELKALAEVARRHQVLVLSDEIYSELHYRGEHVSLARFYPEGTIVSNGISKWAGAGGWRLGFMLFPRELNAVLQSMVVIASETFTSVSAPIQMASISAFEESAEIHQYVLACRRIMQACGDTFSRRLIDAGIDVVMPDGGFYNLPDFSPHREVLLKHGITNAHQLCQSMLDATGVAALPGPDFGLQQGLHMRLAFVDFDGAHLLQRVLEQPDLALDAETPELSHLFSATQRIRDWLDSL